jgi:hypothetical protein
MLPPDVSITALSPVLIVPCSFSMTYLFTLSSLRPCDHLLCVSVNSSRRRTMSVWTSVFSI